MTGERVPRRPSVDPDTGLGDRERALVDVLAAMHREHGMTARFTAGAVALVTGEEWAGSLAGLVMRGFAAQLKASGEKEIGYRLTERGWALFANVPLELADGQGETLGPVL